jgi:flagellar hook assembly protein FlgD
MENLALFDFEGEALASWNAFTAPSGTDAEEFEFPTQEGNVAAVYPNPTASTVTITVLAVPSRDAEILDSLGRPVVRLSPAERRGTETVWVWDGRDGAGRTVSPGLYLFAVETSSGRWHGQIVRR